MLKHNIAQFVAFALMFTGLPSCQTAPSTNNNTDCSASENQPMSRLQYVGSHNSYHIAPSQKAFEWLSRTHPDDAARHIKSLNYSHQPLDTQLASGHRMFELDVYPDSTGGRFTASKLKEITGADSTANLLDYNESQLLAPGLKTVHYPNFDLNSHCPLFRDCVKQISEWHEANPDHLPLIIMMEVKEGALFDMDDTSKTHTPIAFKSSDWSELHDTITSVFETGKLIRPSDIVDNKGKIQWPSIEKSRGKIAFLLFDYGKNVSARYSNFTKESGKNPILHLQKDTTAIKASWARHSVPNAKKTLLAINNGKIVYSKADTIGVFDKSRRVAALQSGANLVATDRPHEFSQKVRVRRDHCN